MPNYAILSSGIRQVAANTLIGNSTGSTGSAEELSATDAKALLGLAATDSPTFAGLTIDEDSSYSIGVSKIAYKSGGGGTKARISVSNVTELELTGSKLAVGSGHSIGFASTSYADSGFLDTVLYRDGAGVIAQRNGTNAQSFRIYNTDDGSQTNYERGSIGWDSNEFKIQSQKGGTGSNRSIIIGSGSYGSIKVYDYSDNTGAIFYQGGVGKFKIRPSNLEPSADNNYGLGTSNRRWSSLYATNSDLSESLTLASHTPATTTNKLYNVGGTLYFNGSAAGGNPFDQDLNTSDAPTFASATIGNMTLSDAGSYDSITSGDARLALRAQDGSMELYLENASDGNDSFRFNTANGIFELFSDADNQIDLRNGTNAQNLNVYNAYTDASNYQRLKIGWNSSVPFIGTENAGTYAATGINFKIAGTTKLQISGTWIYLKGSCKPDTDGTRWFGDSTKRWALGYWGGNTVTTSTPIFDGTQTWNDAGVEFTGILANITNTASASTSKLIDLQVGGSSKFKVDNAGNAVMSGVVNQMTSSASLPSTTEFPNDQDWGIHHDTLNDHIYLAFNKSGSIKKTLIN